MNDNSVLQKNAGLDNIEDFDKIEPERIAQELEKLPISEQMKIFYMIKGVQLIEDNKVIEKKAI